MKKENKENYMVGFENGIKMATDKLTAILESYGKTVLDYEGMMHIFAEVESGITPNVLELEHSGETGKILQGTGMAHGFVYVKMACLEYLVSTIVGEWHFLYNGVCSPDYEWTAEFALTYIGYVSKQFEDAVWYTFRPLGYKTEDQIMLKLEFLRYGSEGMWEEFFEETKETLIEQKLEEEEEEDWACQEDEEDVPEEEGDSESEEKEEEEDADMAEVKEVDSAGIDMYREGFEVGVLQAKSNMQLLISNEEEGCELSEEGLMNIFERVMLTFAPGIAVQKSSVVESAIILAKGTEHGMIYVQMRMMERLAYLDTMTKEEVLKHLDYILATYEGGFNESNWIGREKFMAKMDAFVTGGRKKWLEFLKAEKDEHEMEESDAEEAAHDLEELRKKKAEVVAEETEDEAEAGNAKAEDEVRDMPEDAPEGATDGLPIYAQPAYKQGVAHGITIAKEAIDKFFSQSPNNKISQNGLTVLLGEMLENSMDIFAGKDSEKIFRGLVDLEQTQRTEYKILQIWE